MMQIRTRLLWAGLVLITGLAWIQVCLAAEHEPAGTVRLHLKAHHRRELPFFVVGMFGGLNNQRMCLLNGLLAAKRHKYTFVLPSFKGERPIHFSHFYSLEHLVQWAKENKVSVTDDLPEDKVVPCQSQRADTPEPTHQQMRDWAEKSRVICLTRETSFFHIEGHDAPMPWTKISEVRSALQPSALYINEYCHDAGCPQVNSILAAIEERYGTREFAAVHVRTEDDMKTGCSAAAAEWERREDRQCWVSEEQYTELLQRDFGVEPGALLFVCSGTDTSEMPTLCGTFQCFNRESIWTERSAEIPDTFITKAFLDFSLARAAQAFYGHFYSTFSTELMAEFEALAKPAHLINPLCPDPDNCP